MDFSFGYNSDSDDGGAGGGGGGGGGGRVEDDHTHMLGGDHEGLSKKSAPDRSRLIGGCLMVTMVQREKQGGGAMATIATTPETKARLLDHLKEGQCFGIHYGHFSDEVPAMGKLLRGFNQSDLSKPPGRRVEYYCPDEEDEKSKHRTITRAEILSAMEKGASVICVARALKQWEAIPAILREIAEDIKIKCSTIRILLLIDRTGAGFIEGKIRDPRIDDVFGNLDGTNSLSDVGIKNFASLMERCYDPQIMPNVPSSFDTLVGPWEGYMSGHQFRNATFPSPYSKLYGGYPLDHAAAILVYSPFTRPSVIAITLLAGRGDETKNLIEAWYNYNCGTPTTFTMAT